MKRFFLSLTFCSFLLVSGAVVLTRSSSAAREDLITALLNLPAPPPPNPLIDARSQNRLPSFYDRTKPPPDDAPIEDLLDYWRHQNRFHRGSAYNPKPSETVIVRLLSEIEKDPEIVFSYLQVIDQAFAVSCRDGRQNLQQLAGKTR